jgi:SNF2 family DNA or RNA helicase
MQIIQTLRLFCCYPPLVIKSLGSISDAKAERLLDILDNIAAQVDEKAIIFTGFHDSADYLNKFISRQFPGVFVAVYDGRIKDTADRELIRKKFSDFPGFAVLIANPRTAGEGLNIVSANHVIHFNLDWNPQKENQASARVLRPGQERTVFIHRMFYKGTVEEYIHARAEHKSQIAQAALSAAEHEADSKSIEQALSMTPLFGYYSRNSISIPKSPSSIDWSAFSREDR